MRLVIDASAAVEYLLRTPVGQRVERAIAGASLLAPELLDAEVLAVLRRAVVSKGLADKRAGEAIDDLGAWPVERIPHKGLLREAWSFRRNVTGYDAFYLATAKVKAATLITADGPLSRAPAPGIGIQNVR